MNQTPRHPGFGLTITRSIRRVAASGLLAAVAFGALAARPLTLRPPRDPARVGEITAAGPHAGDCDQCHTTHGDDQPGVYPNALVGPDDNTLCEKCHALPWAGGSWAGDPLYLATGHGSSTRMVWPGPEPPGRIEPDAATKCLNCHDPHGWTDASGTIPMLGLRREEALCLGCHDGSPATANIAAELVKPYRHPTGTTAGRHSGPLESLPTDFGVSPLNRRHAECEDCHDPHVSRAEGAAGPQGNDASQRVLGASRVLVLNGAAGAPPAYTFVPGSDTLSTPNAEYQLCFKCHSSWTTQPTGQTDFGLVLNPANPSYHPVEAAGRNPGIATQAFTPGWSANSLTRCGDCHGSDFGSVAGPHGSSNQFLLRAPSPGLGQTRATDPGDLCFSCHSYDVYANPGSPGSVHAASRFNEPGADKGHAIHVGEEHVMCWMCHTTHGSTTLPFLLTTASRPGITSITITPGGGSCAPTCHGPKSYTVNYAR